MQVRIPQYYFNARGKKEYTQLMRKVFRYGNFLKKHDREHSVKQKIAERFVVAYNVSQVDQELLDIYFRYFADTINIKNLGDEPM